MLLPLTVRTACVRSQCAETTVESFPSCSSIISDAGSNDAFAAVSSWLDECRRDQFWADSNRFIESTESLTYTRLLDTKRMLAYEVSAIKSWIKEQESSGNEEDDDDEEGSSESKASASDSEEGSDDPKDKSHVVPTDQREINSFQDSNLPAESEESEDGAKKGEARWVTIHRLYHHSSYTSTYLTRRADKISYFLDRPQLFTGDSMRDLQLKGTLPIRDLEKYLYRGPFYYLRAFQGLRRRSVHPIMERKTPSHEHARVRLEGELLDSLSLCIQTYS